MGYRSKVIIGVKEGKLSDQFDDVLRKHDFNPDKSNDYLKINTDDWNTTTKMKTYVFDYVKWYESEDWCKEIMGWLEKQDDYTIDRQDGLKNVFCVGMGEEGEFHSEIGSYWEYTDYIRDINLIKQ